jgi:tetratricopeptide (TPR) repeat protein
MIELYDPIEHQSLRYRYGTTDLRLAGLATGCATKTLAGYFDQARRDGEAMVKIASESGNPYLLAQALLQNAWTHEVRREIVEEKSYITSVIPLAEEYRFHLLLGNAHMGEGRIMIVEGQVEAGMARLLQGLAEVRAFGHTMAQSHYATFLVEGYVAFGQFQKGLEVIDEALAAVDQSGEHWFDAELHRLKGDFLWMQGEALEIVEGYYEKAIEIARRQQGKLWELRATVSLARLWQTQEKSAAAHARLAETYAWFTEGFDTPDLQEARTLLATLAPTKV